MPDSSRPDSSGPASSRPGLPGERVALEILDPGALTTVQDLGRPGYAHLGVPRSGALDDVAHRLANRLVGNPEDAAALETTLTGVRFRVTRGTRLAVTGADCAVQVDHRPVPWGAAVSVAAGQVVKVGVARTGLRSSVALAGGIDVAPVLGSRSTDLLSGLGPAPLVAGQVLPLGAAVGPAPAAEAVRPQRGAVLRVDPGPRTDWFTEAAVAGLHGASYRVEPASNRIGLRLAGVPIARRRTTELPPEPMVLGAVQVPPDGQPVVFLRDHPTTGGYPVIGVVRGADLGICAQARPGDSLVLRLTPRVAG